MTIFFMRAAVKKYPELRDCFDFDEFNPIQQSCLPLIMEQDDNLIVSAPTSSGKTVLFELAILKYAHLPSPLCLYLAPIKSLCHEKYSQWERRFGGKLTVAEVTGDSI
jgi:ATP-dependent DNA helicase HFM1/MER3